jgi:hypothetical protein
VRPEFCEPSPPRKEGAGNAGRLGAPAALRVNKKTRKQRHHRFTGPRRHSLRNGFNGFLRALSGDRAFLPPSPADHPADLTPASRRQDHTTSPSTVSPLVDWRHRVHRIPCPTFVTIAKRPSYRARDGRASRIDLPDGTSGKNPGGGLDGGANQPGGPAEIERSRARQDRRAFVLAERRAAMTQCMPRGRSGRLSRPSTHEPMGTTGQIGRR